MTNPPKGAPRDAETRAYFAERQRLWRKNNRQRYLENIRRNGPTAKARAPEKAKCRERFNNAVLRGLITRQPCRVCGSLRSEGHHADYSKPFEVDWLCSLHHKAEHRK